MKVINKNKSENKTNHKCDFCGKEPEDIWMGHNIDGQYCLEHYRELHEDLEAFDIWYKEYHERNKNL